MAKVILNRLAQEQAAKDMASVANPTAAAAARRLQQDIFVRSNVAKAGSPSAEAAASFGALKELGQRESDRLASITRSRQVLQKTDRHFKLLEGIPTVSAASSSALNEAWIETAAGLKLAKQAELETTDDGGDGGEVLVWEAGSGSGGQGTKEGGSWLYGRMEIDIGSWREHGWLYPYGAYTLLYTAIWKREFSSTSEFSSTPTEGVFFVWELTNPDTTQANGYGLAVHLNGRNWWTRLAMHPQAGTWHLDGNAVHGLAPFASLQAVVGNLQQREHQATFCELVDSKHTEAISFVLTTPVAVPKGYNPNPPTRGSQDQARTPSDAHAGPMGAAGGGAAAAAAAAAASKKKGGRKVDKKKKAVKGGTAQMEVERTYIEKSRAQASFLAAPITAVMMSIMTLFNLARSVHCLTINNQEFSLAIAVALLENLLVTLILLY